LQSFWSEEEKKNQRQWWNEDNKGLWWQEVSGGFNFNQEEVESGFVLTRKSLS